MPSGIFIIEGAITCFLGIVGYWALVDFPDKAHKSWKFLNEREVRFIIDRVNTDRGDAKPESWSLTKFLKGGADIKVWGFAMVRFADCCGRIANSLDLLQYHNRDVFSGLLPAHHSDGEHGIQYWRSTVPSCTAVCFCRHRNVRNRLGR